MNETSALTFVGLVDLAAQGLGGKVLAVSDEFFAGAENLTRAGRAVFIPEKFTERGKWMDGWESRRRRTAGHDWCILELGARGRVLGFDIDTQHFRGNHPAYAGVEGVLAARGTPPDQLARMAWSTLLAPLPLAPDAQNLFACEHAGTISHVRLNIFPDGGVARLRVYGRVAPEWEDDDERDAETLAHAPSPLVDLASVRRGGVALACSDARFGPMNNLLLPGRAANMGGGWETRRSRGPNRDWIIVKLGARGTPEVLEIDTQHFKGNFPDRCAVDGIDAAEATIPELIASGAWVNFLPEQKLSADTRHFYREQLVAPRAISHVRLTIVPDGGLSRLRVWSRRHD